jgi:hypothetical protein
MHVSFILTVNLDDTSDLPGIASEIEDDLANFEVISVHPWARPSLAIQGPSVTAVPTTQQPTQNIQ